MGVRVCVRIVKWHKHTNKTRLASCTGNFVYFFPFFFFPLEAEEEEEEEEEVVVVVVVSNARIETL